MPKDRRVKLAGVYRKETCKVVSTHFLTAVDDDDDVGVVTFRQSFSLGFSLTSLSFVFAFSLAARFSSLIGLLNSFCVMTIILENYEEHVTYKTHNLQKDFKFSKNRKKNLV